MTRNPTRPRKSVLAQCLPWAVAALTLGAGSFALAGGNIYEGEGAVSHGAAPAAGATWQAPSASTAASPADTSSAAAIGSGTVETVASADSGAPAALTRSEVRQSARHWKEANIATPSGEVGDTPQVLKAREEFYALQTDVREIQYLAEAERQQQAFAAAQQALQADDDAIAEAGSDSILDSAVALQDEPARPQPDEPREIYVRPEMTVAELMSALGDDPDTSEVTVLMVSADDDID